MGSVFWYRFLLLGIFILITDTLLYLGLKRVLVTKKKKGLSAKRFTIIYLIVTGVFLLYAVIHFIILRSSKPDYTIYRQYLIIAGILLAVYLPKAIALFFIIIEYVLLLLIQIISYILQNRRHYDFVKSVRRIRILTWTGIISGLCMFIYVLYGMIGMRTDYKVVQQSIRFYDLPPSFDKMKIVLFSDTHLGSFFNPEDVRKGLDMIRDQSPDLIVFTGDMINVSADETNPYIKMFRELNAPNGMYAILGNHDLGDYMKFYEPESPGKVADALIKKEQEMGFKVLRNDHIFLHRGRDSIALIGVDSWGLPPFKKIGDLQKAIKGLDPRVFKILLSHSPSQWTSEVRGNTEIDLTLSGHTHAMQMGINLLGILWSPSEYKYPKWMGSYQWGTQFLYVNPGFGYLGFPGRIGIRPEITVITLRRG
jgi:uncharacterized protein